MENRSSLVLPLVVVTIGCILAVEFGYWGARHYLRDAAAAWRRQTQAATVAAASKTPTSVGYQIILARNLFAAAPGRGRGATPVGEGIDGAASGGGMELVLMGTIDDALGGSRAIFLDKKSGRQQLYRLGDKVQGASLEEIGRGRATLAIGGRRQVFDLREAAKHRIGLPSGQQNMEPPAENPPLVGDPAPEVSPPPSPGGEQVTKEGKARRSFRLQRAPRAAGEP